MNNAVENLLGILDLEPLERNLFRGRSPQNSWQRVFGGQVIGQALVAASRTVEADRPPHSLHAYFILPGDPKVPIVYTVERNRDGRSFTTRSVTAIQHERSPSVGLRIFETDPDAAPKPRQSFKDDLVGRFRSGYQINRRPATLEEWRVTTGDPDVAERIHELFGGEKPQEWDATGEDNIEVFTKAKRVKVIVDSPSALRQEMVLWGRSGAIRPPAWVTWLRVGRSRCSKRVRRTPAC